jgi:murein DD-endopeptidase MepM/ murein hydrolase activator NlpD
MAGDTYQVQSGETLSAIARRNGTTVGEIQKLNGISNPDVVSAGQTLAMPKNGSPPAAPPAAKTAAKAGEKVAEDKSENPPGKAVSTCLLEQKGPTKYRLGGDDNVDVLYFEHGGKATKGFLGGAVEGEVGIGARRMDHGGNFAKRPLGGSHQLLDTPIQKNPNWDSPNGRALRVA